VPQNSKVIIVEGLIGSGKTTLTRELGRALGPNTLTLFEPDEKEGKEASNPYLASFYGDAPRWAFTMQAHLLAERFRMHLHAQWHALQGHGDAVLDRSFYGDTAFAHLQLQLGQMTQHEFDTYSRLYHAMTASVLLPTVCVRVLTSPEICNERVSRRMTVETGRKCETAIDLDYLQGLDREIDHMVGVLRSQGVTVLDVPWDESRPKEEDRKEAVSALVSRIQGVLPFNSFLDTHRRRI